MLVFTLCNYCYAFTSSLLHCNLIKSVFHCYLIKSVFHCYLLNCLFHRYLLNWYSIVTYYSLEIIVVLKYEPGSAPSNRYGWFEHFLSCIRMLRSLILSDLPAAFRISISFMRIFVYLKVKVCWKLGLESGGREWG